MNHSYTRPFHRLAARSLLRYPLLLAFLLGLAVGAADAWFESRFSPGTSFVGALYAEADQHHLYFRLIVLAAFVLAGFLAAEVVFLLSRKESEEKLLESGNQFRTLHEISPSAILVEDEEENVVSVNKRFCELYGYSQDEMLGLKA